MPSATDIWAVVIPQAGTNYVTNPSAEVGTAGWTATSGTGSRAIGGTHGAYGFTFTASAQNGRYATATLATTSGTSSWTAACDMPAGAAGAVLVLRNATDNTDLATASWTSNSARLTATASVASGKALQVWIRDTRASAWTQLTFDAVQLENDDEATTYIDGDQDGCKWLGEPHNSLSTRDGFDGRGGVVTTFETLGLWITEQMGIGMPEIDVATRSLALSDGSSWTRTQAKDRVFSLIARIFGTGTPAGMHAARRTATNGFGVAFGPRRGPLLLRYSGASTTAPRQIVAHYERGLEWGKIDAADEVVPLRFRAPDPFWYSETDSSATLTPNATVTGINNFLLRDRNGAWSNMAGGQSTPASGNPLGFKRGPDGYLYAWGSFQGSFSGATRSYVARWDGSAWVDAISGGADPNGEVAALAFNPAGGYAIGGNFTLIGANTRTRIAAVSSSLVDSALSTGANSNVDGLAYDQLGQLWATGAFSTIGGVAATRAALWNGAAWAALAAAAERMSQLQQGPDGLMYGLGAGGIYAYNATWVSIGTVPSGAILDMEWRPDGLYAFGSFTSIAGVAAAGAARYRGGAWEAIATTTTGSSPQIRGHFGPDGVLHGTTTAASIDGSFIPSSTSQPVSVRWDGSTWSVDDVILPATAAATSVWPQADGSIAYGFQASANTSVSVPGLTTVTNNGSAEAYPVITIDGGQGYVHAITNLTTGKRINFNQMVRYANEYIVVDLRPGRKTVTSNYRQLIGSVLPGSDLDTWSLAPGANTIQVFSDTLITGVAIHWRQRFWSSD